MLPLQNLLQHGSGVLRRCAGAVTLQCCNGHKLNGDGSSNFRQLMLLLPGAGCADGTCVIWDFITRDVAKKLRDEDQSAAITSLCWSKCGCQILTSATDKSLTLWDVSEGRKIARIVLEHTALYAGLHPSCNPSLALACPFIGAPILVDLNSIKQYVLPVSAHSDGMTNCQFATACFNKRGDLIYIGNLKGEILIVDTETRKVQAVFQVPGNGLIRRLVFSKSGKYLLSNSGDSTIRVFENCLPEHKAANALKDLVNGFPGNIKLVGSQCLKLSKEFENVVNSFSWKAACFSGDSEFVVGAPASKEEHKICIWSRYGQLIKILEGPKEGLIDLSWHPIRPLLVSVSMSGEIFIWANVYTEKWSAFDPNFKEINENEIYHAERTNKSHVMPDINMMPDNEKVKIAQVDQDEEVDITATEKFLESDSDDSGERLYYLRAIPLPDSPEQQELISQSDRPPALDKEKANQTPDRPPEPIANRTPDRPPEPSANQAPDIPLEEPSLNERVGRKGRVGRKRKLPQRVFEMQAGKEGRTFAEALRLKRRVGEMKSKLSEKGVKIRVGRELKLLKKEVEMVEKKVEMFLENERIRSQKQFQTIAEEPILIKRPVGRPKRKLPQKEVEVQPENEGITFQEHIQTIAEEPSLKRRVGRPKRELSEEGAKIRVGRKSKSPEKEVEKPENELITFQKHFQTIAEERSVKRRVGRPKRNLSEERAETQVGQRKSPEKEVEVQSEKERLTFQENFQTIAEESSLKRRVGRPKRKMKPENEPLTFEKHLQTIAEEPSLSGRVKRQRKFSEKGAEMQAQKELRAFKKQETRAKRETGVNFMTPNRLESHPSSASSSAHIIRLPETEASYSPSVGPVTLDIVEGGLLNTISKLKLESKENGDQEALGSSQDGGKKIEELKIFVPSNDIRDSSSPTSGANGLENGRILLP